MKHPSNIKAVVITCAMCVIVVKLTGCKAAEPTDATANALAETQAATERAVTHLDKAIDLNQQLQRDIDALRKYRPAGAK